MTNWEYIVANSLTPELPTAPPGWHWEPVVTRTNDDVDTFTVHAKWRLIPIEEVQS